MHVYAWLTSFFLYSAVMYVGTSLGYVRS
jgi:hypothetical protein